MENITPFISFTNANDSDYYYNYTGIDVYSMYGTDLVTICLMGILSLVCLLGIIGNGLVIWFGIFRMKKTVNVVWFLSLALADFSLTFFIPLYITQIIFLQWPLGEFMCKLFHFLVPFNMYVSVLQLTVISIDRCICVMFPVWCHNRRRPRLAFLVVLTIWLVSLALAIPSAISAYIVTLKICIDVYVTSRVATILGFVFFFLLPLVIIVFCYIVIVLHIRRKRIIASSKPFKSIVAIIIAFFICWCPYHLFSLVLLFFSSIRLDVLHYGYLISQVLIIMNSCINPIIYVFIGRDFKEKFCGSFQAVFEKAFLEDGDKTDFEKLERCTALPSLHQNCKEDVEARD